MRFRTGLLLIVSISFLAILALTYAGLTLANSYANEEHAERLREAKVIAQRDSINRINHPPHGKWEWYYED